jgi:hypothetical protein
MSSLTFDTSTNPTLTTINTWISEASSLIDSRVGFSLEATAYTDFYDYGGESNLMIKRSPVLTISSLSENTAIDGETPVWVSKTEGIHFTHYDNGDYIKLFKNQWCPARGRSKNLRLVYTSGYSTIPGDYQMLATKLVAERVLSSQLQNNVFERNDGGSISVGSINIVEQGSYGVGTFRELKRDIKDLWDRVLCDDKGFRVHRYV